MPDGKRHSLKDAFNAAAGSKFMAERPIQPKLLFDHIRQDNAHIVQTTLNSYPPAVGWRDEDGLTGLMVAAQEGSNGAITILIHADPSLIDAKNENGSTALMYAAYAGKATSADLLMKAGADVNLRNYKGHTPLMSAAAYGHKNTIGVLLAAGADPRVASEDGFTAADFASDNGHTEIASLLKKMSAELDAQEAKTGAMKEAAQEMTKEAEEPAAEEAAPPAPNAEEKREAEYKKSTSALQSLHGRMSKAGLFG